MDTRGQIECRRQDRDQVERERHNGRDYDLYGPYYDQPARRHSPVRGRDMGGIMLFSHNMRKVIWPPNFKPSVIDKYDGSTNPVEWLEVYQLAIKATEGTCKSGQTTCQFASHRQLGPGSLDTPLGQFDPKWTSVSSSSATSGPPVSDLESNGTWATLSRRRETPFGSSSSIFAIRGMPSWRLTISQSS
jgi:hypothetical protein